MNPAAGISGWIFRRLIQRRRHHLIQRFEAVNLARWRLPLHDLGATLIRNPTILFGEFGMPRILELPDDRQDVARREQSLREQEAQATDEAVGAEMIADLDAATESDARAAYSDAAARIRKEAEDRHAPVIQPLAADAAAKAETAKNAADAAKKATDAIEKRDGEMKQEAVANGACANVIAEAWERFRDESAAEELAEILSDGSRPLRKGSRLSLFRVAHPPESWYERHVWRQGRGDVRHQANTARRHQRRRSAAERRHSDRPRYIQRWRPR
jgi:hypothetical protein